MSCGLLDTEDSWLGVYAVLRSVGDSIKQKRLQLTQRRYVT